MPNDPSFSRNQTSIGIRAGECPNASFDNGVNIGGSNAPGIGIANAGVQQTSNLEEQLPNWTLEDQHETPRAPQDSQHIGGNGLGAGISGLGTDPVYFGSPSNSGDGYTSATGEAALTSLAGGWEDYAGSEIVAFDPTSWEALPADLNVGVAVVWRAIDVNNAGIFIAVGDAGRLSRSDDYGITWVAQAQGLGGSQPAATNITSICCTDGADTWVIGMATGYAMISVDAGLTWSDLPQGLGKGVNADILNIESDFSGNVLASHTANGLTRSIDYGATWINVTPDNLGTSGGLTVNSIVAIARDQFIAWQGGGGISAKTLDGGATWAEFVDYGLFVNGGPTAKITSCASIGSLSYCIGPGAANKNGRLISIDAGKTFNVYTDVVMTTTSGVAYDNLGNLIIVGNGASSFYSKFADPTLVALPEGLSQGASATYTEASGRNGVFVAIGDGYVSRSPTYS